MRETVRMEIQPKSSYIWDMLTQQKAWMISECDMAVDILIQLEGI